MIPALSNGNTDMHMSHCGIHSNGKTDMHTERQTCTQVIVVYVLMERQTRVIVVYILVERQTCIQKVRHAHESLVYDLSKLKAPELMR